MKLVIIDSQKVGYVYNDRNMIVEDKALKRRGQEGIKTLTNKFGGTLAGLEKAVEDGEYDNYGRIISLPMYQIFKIIIVLHSFLPLYNPYDLLIV